MKIERKAVISWKATSDLSFSTIVIDAAFKSSEYFECNYKNQKNELCEKTTIEILLTAAYAPHLRYDELIFFETAEKIEKIYKPFEHFDHKSLSATLYCIITNQRKIIIQSERPHPFLVRQNDINSLSVNAIIDAAFLHPSWDLSKGQRISSAAAVQPSGTIYQFNYSIYYFSLSQSFVPVQQWIYPFALKAAFILTDHCDFDNAQKLKIFLYGNNNDGWAGRGLKITKGVFTLAPLPGEERKNDSLEDQPYAKLIEALHKDGSEIVPHALKSKGQLSSTSFHKALAILTKLYRPQTWIDHGSYLKYCYSQGAKENPDYMLVNSLKQGGFNNLWSYHDVNTDAIDTLNIFSARRFGPRKIIMKIFRNFFTGKWLIAAHYLRSLLHRGYKKNIVTDFLMYAMASTKGIFIEWKKGNRNLFKSLKIFFSAMGRFNSYRNNIPVPYDNKDLLQYAPPLYCENRMPFPESKPGDMLMFSTFETTHLLDIYNQKALDNLIKEYGTHIGHTYILNDLPYLNHIFSGKSDQMKLSEKWIKFTALLSDYVNNKLLWNPNMGEYVAHIKELQNVCITYVAHNKVSIQNGNSEAIEGYTIIIPAVYKPSGYLNGLLAEAISTDNNYHFFVFDVQPGTSEFEYLSSN